LHEGLILDDIEFFEIKKFALQAMQFAAILATSDADFIQLPNSLEVAEILDPENRCLPRFFIYDEYDARLSLLRKKIKSGNIPAEEMMALEMEVDAIEDQVREHLSKKLQPFYKSLHQAFEAVAELDFQLAKATFSLRNQLCRPEISSRKTSFTSLFNLEVKNSLSERGKHFQPIDIEQEKSPCIITGANMGGKTVLLRSVAVAQFMFQFGFYVPASTAHISPVDDVCCSFSRQADRRSGLSAFAAEIVFIDEILLRAALGEELLVLLDEPAQTTNPEEGTALVSAIATVLLRNHTRSLITTHYSGIHCDCKKLNVKGLKLPQDGSRITIEDIGRFMDYSLEPNDGSNAPMNAINIAEVLAVNDELLAVAKVVLKMKRGEK
jgi:DNA mismatch repair ATPase MutS